MQFQNYLKATSGYSTSCEGVNYSCVYLIKTKSCKALIQHNQSCLLLLSKSLIEGRLVEIGPWNNYNTKEINNLHKMLKSKFQLQVFMTIMSRERKQSTLILCVIRFNSRRTTRTGTDVLLCCAQRTILGYSVGPAGNINRKWSSSRVRPAKQMRNCIYCFDCEWVAEEEVVVVGTVGGFGSITI